MLGKPKYNYDEEVIFKINYDENEYKINGRIFIIDAYGTLEQNKEVSYDIMVNNSPLHDNGPCLFKHIIETQIYPSKVSSQ